MAKMKITGRRRSDTAAIGNFRFQIVGFQISVSVPSMGRRTRFHFCNLAS